MALIQITLVAFLAFISSSSAQYRQQQQQSRGSSCGNCVCTQQYVPICATDGRTETTYGNKCQLECAQKCTPGLRQKFEGVCAVPYERESKNYGGKGSWGQGSSNYLSYETTKRPYIQTTTRRYNNRPPITTTRRSYYPSYPVPTTRRPYTPSYPVTSTTRRPYYPEYPETTGRPTYPIQTTRRPYQPIYPYPETTTRGYYPNPSYEPTTRRPSYGQSGQYQQSASSPMVQTTTKPWWQSAQSRYPQPSYEQQGGYGRQIRQNSYADDDDEEGDDYSEDLKR